MICYLESLSKEVKWAPNQVPIVWFHDKRCGEDVRLVDERQMADLFEMFKSEMSCRVIVSIFDKDVVAEHEYDTLVPLCVLPPDDVSLDIVHIHTQYAYAPVDDNETHEPIVTQGGGVSASKEADSKGPADMDADASEPNHEPEPEPDHEPDLFDNDEEYVGVNDEDIYLPEAHAQAHAQPHTHPYENAQAHENAQPNENAQPSDNVATEGGIPLDVEVNDADPQEVNVIHDPENPKIERGSKFPDIML